MPSENLARITDHVAAVIAKRARQKDIPPWQKARELLGLRDYMRSAGEPHSTRDVARLTGIGPTTVLERIQIATALTEKVLTKARITEQQLSGVRHVALLRIAKLPPYLRANPLRAAAVGNGCLAAKRGQEPAAAPGDDACASAQHP
jgi:hypothetical protein